MTMNFLEEINYTGGMTGTEGFQKAHNNFDAIDTEIHNARGSAASIAARLSASLNQDGTLIAAQTTPVDWKTTGYTAAQVDSNTFEVTSPSTDLTAILAPGRVVCFNADGTALYAAIRASSYGSSKTTVDVFTTNVPATITQLDIGIVHLGDAGSFMPVEPLATKPAYAAKYAGRFLLALDTGILWFGNPIWAIFEAMGGNAMIYKDWDNSAAKGGTGVAVAAGATETTKLDFGTPTTLCGILRSLVVAGTSRAAVTSDDFNVKVFTKEPTGTWTTDVKYCVFEQYHIDGRVSPFGLVASNLMIDVLNEDTTDTDCLWVSITNNEASGSSTFDIEARVEQGMEG